MHSAKAAVAYLAAADYYSTSPGDLLGHGFEHLDISSMHARDVMECLAHNLDPATGKLLRPHAKEGDRIGMDMTFTSPKSVGLAREVAGADNAGDPRIEAAHREAVAYAMGYVEQDMQCRVRVGGADHDRTTGNMCAYRVTHRDTRINAEDQKPDPHLHDHVFVLNLTHDPVEEKWKAAQMAGIKHDAPYYEAIYENRLAANLRNLGYGVRRDGKSFEIAGIDRALIDKFSRRHAYIKKTEKAIEDKNGKTLSAESKSKLGATTRLGKAKDLADDLNGYYVSRLTNQEREQLSHLEFQPSYVSTNADAVRYAVSHTFERQSVTEERKLYEVAIRHGIGSVTPEGVIEESKRQGALLKDGQVTTKAVLAEESRIIDFAREGKGTMRPLISYAGSAGRSLETQPDRDRSLSGAEGGYRAHSLGLEDRNASVNTSSASAHPATSAASGQQKGRPDESKRPLRTELSGDTATLSAEPQADSTVDRFAGVGKGIGANSRSGTFGAKITGTGSNLPVREHGVTAREQLSPEQAALVNHVLTSSDQLILNIGDAGTGKTHAIKSAFSQIHCPVEMLAPSANASRGVLRSEGFTKADTVASFLLSTERQAGVKNGVIWVDEAGLLPIRDLSRLTDIAKQQNARLVLMGDSKQHASPARSGNMLNVLQEYAGLVPGRLQQIWRQKHKGYKAIVSDIAAGKRDKAFDQLAALGWVQKTESNAPLVEEYVEALRTKKANQTDQERVLVVAPTHVEADEVTAAIRKRLQDDGKLGTEERLFEQLVPLNWTEAERDDRERYDGSEVLCFHRNSGTFRAGQKVSIAEFQPGDRWSSPAHFSVYRKEEIGLTAGDLVRFTSRGSTVDKKHRIDNGMVYRVKGFDKDDNLVLGNGWTVGKDMGHLTHGYVSTSHASQGKTVDRVLIAMGSESRGAISAEQFYVSVSRGRESAKVFSDMTAEELKAAIQRTDTRKSATELIHPKRKPKTRRKKFLERMREGYEKLRERVASVVREPKQLEREYSHER